MSLAALGEGGLGGDMDLALLAADRHLWHQSAAGKIPLFKQFSGKLFKYARALQPRLALKFLEVPPRAGDPVDLVAP